MSRGEGRAAEDSEGGLSWRDYIALFVAAVETVGLPLLVFIIVVLAALLIARFVR